MNSRGKKGLVELCEKTEKKEVNSSKEEKLGEGACS